jgi:hypothetical protein
LPQCEATLPQAGPAPVFQTALKDSRFGFSASEGSFNLSKNVLNIGQHVRAISSNPTHSNIDDNGNNDEDSSDSSSEDSDSDDNNDNNDKGNYDFYTNDANNNEGIFGNHIMGKSLTMSLVIYELIV